MKHCLSGMYCVMSQLQGCHQCNSNRPQGSVTSFLAFTHLKQTYVNVDNGDYPICAGEHGVQNIDSIPE